MTLAELLEIEREAASLYYYFDGSNGTAEEYRVAQLAVDEKVAELEQVEA